MRAEATELAPVGTVASAESVVQQLDPAAAAAFGITADPGRVTRELAMSVPAVRRGRALIAGTIGTLPLVNYRSRNGGVEQLATGATATLLSRLDPTTTPAHILTWTVDDLLFYGVSWWRVVDRETVGGVRIGYPTAVRRIPLRQVRIDYATGRVYVDNVHVPDRDLIRFDGPDEGVLSYGAPAIRLALALMRAGQRTADDDVPSTLLRPAADAGEITDAEAAALLTSWETARKARRTAWLNRAIEHESISSDARNRQLTELSQLASTELARLMNLPASRIGAPQGSGMTYTNTEADRRELVDTTLAQYLTPLWQRLSMPDVSPAGQAVAVDLTGFLRGTTTELVSAGVSAIDAGLADADEVRTRWLGLPPRPRTETPS